MADYQLNGLNTRDFEHITQALALKVISPGVTPFGDGSDGGREATFNGKMRFHNQAEIWDGYLIIQCKFKQRPSSDSTENGKWVLDQLESDLKKFLDMDRNLSRPEYYILVTNIVLTPVEQTGSKDKVIALLEKYKLLIGYKDYDVWDYDKLCRMLDGQSDIRNSYYAYILNPSDVLANLHEYIQGIRPDFDEIMSLFLQQELRSDQFVKLEQAGYSSDVKTSLAQVFIDLPVSVSPLTEPPIENNTETLIPGIVKSVLNDCARILKPSILSQTYESNKQGAIPIDMLARYVLVGGPGQGKSTVGQFICQLYRSALLASKPEYQITNETKEALNIFREQYTAGKIDLPHFHRFPIRIVLDKFASSISKGEVNSLLGYIKHIIVTVTGREVNESDVINWLKSYPWLIILDGLDEVPATSNRSQVLSYVIQFWDNVTTLDADLFMLATTRPQGYNDDFSPKYYQHKYLLPLSNVRALFYASRLVVARYGLDTERSKKILERLSKACEHDVVSRLMRSPLQITIMSTLVERTGQPPQERWRLFDMYYDVIYQREMERDIPASIILQERQTDVDTIHQRVGLLLQSRGEIEGSFENFLSSTEFSEIVRTRITEEGYEGEELDKRTQELTDAALNRLVFLVGLEHDHIGFEIRSLQEFMAAEALMNGKEDVVIERLESIAPIDYWRNVFLFAAGKCFSDREYLRDMVTGICDRLNDPEDILASKTLSGSRLALDILYDGITREQRKYARQLTRLSLTLLDTVDEITTNKLIAIYSDSFATLYIEIIKDNISKDHFEIKLGTWSLLKGLVNKGISWAIELSNQFWPQSSSEQLEIFKTAPILMPVNWLDKFIKLVPMISPFTFFSFIRENSINVPASVPDWLWSAFRIQMVLLRNINTTFRINDGLNITLSITGLEEAGLKDLIPLQKIPFSENSWAPFCSLARFIQNPTSETISDELTWLSDQCEMDILGRHGFFPWPFAACLMSSETREDLFDYSKIYKQNEMGNYETWSQAENRWTTEGIILSDLDYVSKGHWPFNKQINIIGFPFASSDISIDLHSMESQELIDLFIDYMSKSSEKTIKTFFAETIISYLTNPFRSNRKIFISPDSIIEIVGNLRHKRFYVRLLDGIIVPDVLTDNWIDLFLWLGDNRLTCYYESIKWIQTEQLSLLFKEDPLKYKNLLRILSLLTLSGNKIEISNEDLKNVLTENHIQVSSKNILRLNFINWSEDEAKSLAFDIVNNMLEVDSEYPSLPMYIFELLNYSDLSDSQKEVFLLELWSLRGHTRKVNYNSLYLALLSLLSKRESGILTEKVWKRLDLPKLSIKN